MMDGAGVGRRASDPPPRNVENWGVGLVPPPLHTNGTLLCRVAAAAGSKLYR